MCCRVFPILPPCLWRLWFGDPQILRSLFFWSLPSFGRSFSIVSSLKLIRRDWEEAVEMTGLRGFNYWRKFLWPVSFPGLVTGSIIGLGEGWEALVATEMIVKTKSGLGHFFQVFLNNPPITGLGILGLLLLIFSLNKLIWLPLLDWGHRQMEG